MFKLFLFFAFITITSCDEIVDFVLNKMVDQSVLPCDNFYRHVCASNTQFGLYNLTEKIYMDELDNNFTVTDDASEYLHTLLQCQKSEYVNGTITRKFIEQYQLACEHGEGNQFLIKLNNLFRRVPNVDCNTTSGLSSYLEDYERTMIENYPQFCAEIVTEVAERLLLHRNLHVVDRFEDTLERIKVIYHHWIKKTPSIINNNVTKIYEKIVNSTYFNDQSASEYIHILTREYQKCRVLLDNWLKDSELTKLICMNKNLKYKQEISYVDDSINAQNDLEEVTIGLPFVTLASKIDTRAFYLGQFGTIIGHEISHSIIQSLGDNYGLFFSERTKNCIQNQFTKTCKYYPEGDCYQDEFRLDDNGADLLGSRGSIQLAKQEFGEKFYQASEKYNNLTNAQLFFYGLASPLCNSLTSGRQHSPKTARYNAIAAQSPEFQKAFHCESDSKMMKSLHKKCYIIGENASIQK